MTSSGSPSGSTAPSFDSKAARYDELRPLDEAWWAAYELLVRLGDLRGQRVLEVACGTGRLAAALTEREHARVWAVDASREMVDRARGLGVNARVARAESLPFKAGWFDRAVTRMAVHLLDRPRAFPEVARVLAPGGRLVVATAEPQAAAGSWFTRFFPSVPALERSRFPDEAALRAELANAGFTVTASEEREIRKTISRDRALGVIRGKAYSTFDLLPPDEYDAGLARAEAELPDAVDYTYRWLVVAADKPAVG
jgi:SAM-dependent methyltransferase